MTPHTLIWGIMKLNTRRRLAATAAILALVVAPVAAPAAQAVQAADSSSASSPDLMPASLAGGAYVGWTLRIDRGEEWAAGDAVTVQWFSGDKPVPGATGSTYKVQRPDIGHQITAMVVVETASGPQTFDLGAGKASLLTLTQRTHPPLPGPLTVGSTITAPAFGWYGREIWSSSSYSDIPLENTDGFTYTYQWYIDMLPVARATSRTYKPRASDVGKEIRVDVKASHPDYNPGTAQSWTGRIGAATLAASIPTIVGTAKVGNTLTANPGQWTLGTKLSYQWYANGKALGGGTGRTFLPFVQHARTKLTVKTTGTLTGYATASRTSAPTAPVASSPYLKSSTPTITGTARLGARLTAKPGTWTSGTKFTYQWYADRRAVKGATSSTFTPGLSEASARITVKVSGTKMGYAPVSKTSRATDSLMAGRLKWQHPKVTGTYKVGSTLKADPGTWTPGAKLTYQWYVQGGNSRPDLPKGATGRTFKITNAHRGKKIWVTVAGRKPGYTGQGTTSFWWAKSVPLDKLTTKSPTVSGTAKVGRTLTATPGRWTSGTKLSYQWYANGKAIKKATTSRFKPVASHRGKKITVKVTGKKSGFATASRTSKATRAVAR